VRIPLGEPGATMSTDEEKTMDHI